MTLTADRQVPVLTFQLADQHYALRVADVLEVAAMVALTHMPDSPPALLGIANRHGHLLPILDLRHVFGLPAKPIDSSTLFIVVGTPQRGAGLVVDAIHQVDYVTETALKSAPGHHRYIRHMAYMPTGIVQIVTLAPLLADYLPD